MNDILSFGPNAAKPRMVSVNMPDLGALLRDLEGRMAARRGFTLATVNLDHLVKLRRDAAFHAAYARHSHVVADGNPIVWASRLAGRPVELVPGSELIAPLCALAARLGISVALFGSTAQTLALAARRLEAAHPGLRVVACVAPPFGFEPDSPAADAMLDDIAASGAGVCFLAFGAPKQERLAIRGFDRVPQCGFVSIGAGLDFIAGSQVRAPVWVRRLALEWLWRMLGNPRRLLRRYADCVAVLPGLALSSLRMRRAARKPGAAPPA